jgi:AraC-like DNA-binding protein
MAYDERRVAPGIEVWHTTGSSGSQRILPDGCMDLILLDERLVVAGPDTTARVHDIGPAEPVTGVRLHAGRGPLLLGVRADEVRDRTVPLEDVWGSARARALTERVGHGPAAALAEWATACPADNAFAELARDLLDQGSSVAEVADAVGYSPRQLHRRLLPAFGYGPQQLGRVLRMLRAVAAADSGLTWSDVAHRAGFVDQAHLVRELRALTGTTPTALREERVRSVQDAA